jgi:hypothetical protein
MPKQFSFPTLACQQKREKEEARKWLLLLPPSHLVYLGKSISNLKNQFHIQRRFTGCKAVLGM